MKTYVWNIPLIGRFSIYEVFLFVTGLMLISSMFMSWISFYYNGNYMLINGFSLIFKYSVMSIILFIFVAGILLFLTSIIFAYNKLILNLKFVQVAILLIYLTSIIITIVSSILLSGVMNSYGNISVLNDTGFGWYDALSGSVIGFIGTLIYIFY
ncbi:MAG: hypothetical protein ACP5RS_04890 [Thermoplasmata archaeon]